MKVARLCLMLMRFAAAIQLVLGIGFWTGHWINASPIHRTIGVIYVLLLCVLAILALLKRAEVGLRWQPWEHTSFLIAGGYGFAGEWSAGGDQRRSPLIADVSDEPYVRFSFERRF